MKSFFRNFYSNKVLVFTSIAFFIVSIFTINLTLNLSETPTNLRNQAQMATPTPAAPNPDGSHCNSKSTKTSCISDTQCRWLPQPCISLSVGGVAGIDFPSPNEQVSRYLACLSDTGCRPNIIDPACRKSDPSAGDLYEPPCTEITNVNACVNTQYLQGAYCNWYFTCVGRPGRTQYRESETGGICNAKFPASATPPGGGGPPAGTATPIPSPTGPPNETACGCNEDNDPPAGDGTFDNICDWAPNTCVDTAPGGFCDPNGNGSYDDADWTLGYYNYLGLGCGTGGPNPTNTPLPTNSPPPGTTNTPVPTATMPASELPTVSRMIHGCSADQTLGPSWDMAAEDIDTHGLTFQQANFMFCMTPHRYPEQAYVFVKFFEEKGQWESTATQRVTVDGASVNVPIWACWSIGRYEALPAGSTTIENTVNKENYLGVQVTNPSTNQLHYPKIGDLATFTDNAKAQGKILNYPVYDAKVVLISNHGIPYVDVRINDQIVSREDPLNPNGHIKFHSSACSESGDPTPTVAIPPSCSYVTELIQPSKWIGSPAENIQDTQELDISNLNIDYTKPIKIGADWGWTGRGNGQMGLVDLPGTDRDLPAGANAQRNESSKIDISTVIAGPAEPTRIGTINCPDVGEYRITSADVRYTYFADGRQINYQSPVDDLVIISNLKDVEREGGSWYTCPKVPGSRPLFSSLETDRPAGEWNEFTIPENVVKLRFDKTFTGDNSAKGSHFTQILVSYCKNIEENTPTPVP